jgi:hypothetical protein
LLHQVWEDSQEHEDGHHLVLKALETDGFLVKGEPDKERRDNAETELGVDIFRASPVLLEHPTLDDQVLVPKWHCEFAVSGVTLRGFLL